MSEVKTAIDQVRKARSYVEEILKHVDQSDWFRQPSEGVTHIAWQVGHLAMAEYALALKRVRGVRDEDELLIASTFRKHFGKGSTPDPDPANNPTPGEIREVFDRVHRQVVSELSELPASAFDEPLDPPEHPMFDTRLGALQWCAQHEFTHAGQIALIRRLMGSQPLW